MCWRGIVARAAPGRALRAVWLGSWIAALAPAPAHGDIPPPEVEQCSGKKVGDSCAGGSCRKGTCARLTADGEVTYACVRCEPGASGRSDGCAVGGDPVGAAGGLLALLAALAPLRPRRRTVDR